MLAECWCMCIFGICVRTLVMISKDSKSTCTILKESEVGVLVALEASSILASFAYSSSFRLFIKNA